MIRLCLKEIIGFINEIGFHIKFLWKQKSKAGGWWRHIKTLSPPLLCCYFTSSRDAASPPAALHGALHDNWREQLLYSVSQNGSACYMSTCTALHCSTGNNDCRLIVICLPSLLHEQSILSKLAGEEVKALWSKEKAWKDMNEGTHRWAYNKGETSGRIDCELTAICGSLGFLLCTLGSSVLFHHSLRHTCTFFPFFLHLSSSSGQLLNSCRCLRSKQQSSDGRLNHQCQHEHMNTHSQNNP